MGPRFVVLGTSGFTIACARALLNGGADVRALISMPADERPLNSADIEAFGRSQQIAYAEVADLNSPAGLRLLREQQPDYIFSTWPKLLGDEVLAIPRLFVIGSHPTDLPHNRGRHPLHWTIDLGLPATSVSFFVMDRRVDAGDILLQVPMAVGDSDTIAVLNRKVMDAATAGLEQLLPRLADPARWPPRPQRAEEATYWRRRTPFDVLIDFRMSTMSILRTIRSFAPPYPAARVLFRQHVVKLIDGAIVADRAGLGVVEHMEPGKVVATEERAITVKAADGIVRLVTDAPLPEELRGATYIHPPAKYVAEGGVAIARCLEL